MSTCGLSRRRGSTRSRSGLAIMLLPVAALLVCRGRRAARASPPASRWPRPCCCSTARRRRPRSLLSLPVAALLYLRPRAVARIAAALSVVAVLTAPLTLPSLADIRWLLRRRRRVQGFGRAPPADLATSPASASPSGRSSAGASTRRARYRAARSESGRARNGCRCTRTMRRCRSGSNSACRARCCSRCCSAGCGCASPRRHGRALYRGGGRRQSGRGLAVAVRRLGHLAGMVARRRWPWRCSRSW